MSTVIFNKFIAQRKTPPKTDLITGQWYSKFSTVYNYAKKNGYALMAMWTAGAGCGHCDLLEESLNTTTWKKWMKSSNVLFWVGSSNDKNEDDKLFGTGYTFCAENQASSGVYYPLIRFYWYDPKTKKTKINKTTFGDVVDNNSNSASYVVNYCKNIFKSYIPPSVETKYKVTFQNFDNTVLKNQQLVVSGSDAIPPDNPVRSGYIFTGWSPSYKNIIKDTICIAQYREETKNEPSPVIPDPEDPEDFPIVRPDNPEQTGQHVIRISDNVTDWCFIGDNDNPNALTEYTKAVIIGNQCERIEASCFMNCENLESVFLGEKCRNIEDYAFYGCKKLKYITCLRPNSYPMNYLGNHAFDGCDSLQEIYLNLSSGYYNVGIGDSCFANCINLTKMHQYNSSFLGSNMFSGCSSLTSLELPLNTNYVFPSALANIPNIKNITIPNSIWFLNDYMFKNDVQLTSVTIIDKPGQKSVMTMLGKDVFSGCSNLTSIALPTSINALSCIDDGFLHGSSIKKVIFNGLPDNVFVSNQKEQVIDFGQYQTGYVYNYYADVCNVINLAKKYHIPIIMMMTNTCTDDPNSPDAGYVLNKKGNYAAKGICGHCVDWSSNIGSTDQWKNFVKNSGYFYVIGGLGPWGHCRFDAKVKWNKKKTECTVLETYHLFDAGKCTNLIHSTMTSDNVGYFFLGYYWLQPNGSVKKEYKSAFESVGGKKNVQPKIDQIKKWLKDYTGPANLNIQYQINEKLTTFGLETSCLYVSSTGKEYICNNTSYIEYIPTTQVDMYETEDFRYGVWYYNARELREFADENHIPVLIEYSSEGCTPCQYFKQHVYNNSEFQKWVQKSKYLFCRIETKPGEDFDHETITPQAYYVNYVWAAESPNYKKQGIPVFMWYWKKDDGPAQVWDISSYHFPADEKGAEPPWTMNELMNMTDSKFSQYTGDDIFNKHDISTLYSTNNILVGRIYDNVANDNTGKYFQCSYKNDIENQKIDKTINIAGYSGPFPTYIQKNQEVIFKPATYQYYTAPIDAQYPDMSFCIFKVENSNGKNIVQYVLSGYNEYENEDLPTSTYKINGYIYDLSSDSDVELFEDIVSDGEQKDLRTIIICLDNSEKSKNIEALIDSIDFSNKIKQKLSNSYIVKLKLSNWNSDLGKALIDFVNNDRRKVNAYGELGFPDWSVSNIPIIYLYLACATCVMPGDPPSIEIAKTISNNQMTSVDQVVSMIVQQFKIE